MSLKAIASLSGFESWVWRSAVFVVAAIVAASACSGSARDVDPCSRFYFGASDSTPVFRPSTVLVPDDGSNEILLEFYSEVYSALDLPALQPRMLDAVEVYRIVVVPAFDNPIVIVIARSESGSCRSVLRYSQLQGTTVDDPHIRPSIRESVHTEVLGSESWLVFAGQVDSSGFWTHGTPPQSVGGYTDVPLVALEGVRGGQYHVVLPSYPMEPRLRSLIELAAGDSQRQAILGAIQ